LRKFETGYDFQSLSEVKLKILSLDCGAKSIFTCLPFSSSPNWALFDVGFLIHTTESSSQEVRDSAGTITSSIPFYIPHFS